MNVIAWLEYELAYYNSAFHRVNHYTRRTPQVLCYCYFTPCEFFTPGLTRIGLLLLLLLYSLKVFFPPVLAGVFHWNPSVIESLQISWILLNILTDFKRSRRSWFLFLFYHSSNLYSIDISVTFMFHSLLGFLVCSLAIFKCSLFFSFLLFSLNGPSKRQNPQDDKFFFSCWSTLSFQVWSSGRNLVTRLYLKIQENFICLFYLNKF